MPIKKKIITSVPGRIACNIIKQKSLQCQRCFSWNGAAAAAKKLPAGLPDFSWDMIPKTEKNYQMNTKCTKWSWNIPNVL
jgi:hypothetical protein